MAEDNGMKTLKRGDVINGRYEIVRALGDGMLGATFLAKHMASEKQVAMKFLHARLVRNPKDRERLEMAFRAAKALKHSGIIRYGELGNYESTVFFTQEYYKAQSLRELMDEYLAAGKSFSLTEACQLTIKILEAVQFLHDSEQVHGNLKPENILVHSKAAGPAGQVVRTIKITDVGLGSIVNPSIFAEGYISREEARYLAPELAGFATDGTSGSDLYSVGVIMYELLVGQPPRGTYLAPTQLRDDLPEHIDDVVEVAMAADPQDRYPTPQDMLNDLQQSFQGMIVSGKPRTSLKNIMLGLGAALALVTLAGMYASSITPEEQKKSATELAIEADERARAAVAARTSMPSEEELTAMVSDRKDMLFVPAGPYLKGRLRQEPMSKRVMKPERKNGEPVVDGDGNPVMKPAGKKKVASPTEPVHKVVNVPGFFIDRFEFPNRVKNADGSPVMPVGKATWEEAAKACESVGKRLCTEEEWEKACKGPENTIYSYADVYDEEMCGKGVEEVHHLGEHQACISGYGVADMSGNLREWTSSQPGAKEDRRVVKGGLRSNNLRGSRCAYSIDERQNFSDSTLGFRCCVTAPAPAEAAPASPEAGTDG
ncbi:MAG: protein kinase [Myxococcota bacterium]|nr:protein kinase [Myxococcota bacterium]